MIETTRVVVTKYGKVKVVTSRPEVGVEITAEEQMKCIQSFVEKAYQLAAACGMEKLILKE